MTSNKKTKPEGEKRWRENIEALTGAIVVALLFKYFILEISKIPSGSMQPTLMGHTETAVFDRVLVDKLSFRYRDPERFEIVVFKHPLERSRVMVKRLVGMPGEQLKIEGGDLWTRPDESGEWAILRPSEPVQDELWRRIDVDDPAQSSWSSEGESAWLAKKRSARTQAPGVLVFQKGSGIRDEYTHGYPDTLRNKVAGGRGRNFVGDVRVEGEVKPTGSVTAFVLQLQEGERLYEFRIPGPAAESSATAAIHVNARLGASSPEDRVESAASGRLAKPKSYAFSAQNLNDRLTLTLDGEVLVETDITASENQRTSLRLAFEGGGGDLDDLHVYRDIYYIAPDNSWICTIPEGNYVMCGDNSMDSADSRLWEEQTITLASQGERSGNYRPGENPLRGANEYRDLFRFKDTWGEVGWLSRDSVESTSSLRLDGPLSELGPIENRPLVPRHLIQGRAVAIFWPLKLTYRLWRRGWLH